MTIKRMDYVGVVVDKLEAAATFLAELIMELMAKGRAEGRWVDRVGGLDQRGDSYRLCHARGPPGRHHCDVRAAQLERSKHLMTPTATPNIGDLGDSTP